LAELGPLVDAVHEEEVDEPRFVPSSSPRSAAEINEMGPAGFAAFVRAWSRRGVSLVRTSPPSVKKLRSAVQDSPGLWTSNLKALTGLNMLYIFQVISGLGESKSASGLRWDRCSIG